MTVEWGLAGRNQYNYLDSLQQIGNAQAQQQQIKLAQQRADQQAYEFGRAQQQDATRVQLANRARGGDFAGARQEAALGGDFDFANALGSLRQDQLAQLSREFDVIGRLHPTLKAIPVEQRAQTALPLLKQAGFSDQELASVDWTDAGLDGAYALSEAGKAALAARLKQQEARVVGDGGALVDGTGKVLYENQKAPEWVFDSEGGNWLQKPGTGTAGGAIATAPGVSGVAGGRTRYGWTPRARNGGDNSDAAVDGKIAGMSRALGIDPSAPFPPGMTDLQIAQALTLSEGGRGSIADRNNNPGNLRDPRTGDYRTFGSKSEGLRAAAAQVRRNRARGQNTIQTMVEGLPIGGGQSQATQSQPGVINVRPPKQGYRLMTPEEKQAQGLDVNSQYQIGPKGQITALGGQGGGIRKSEAELRKEFNSLPEVKEYIKVRPQFNTLRDLAKKRNPTAQDDIAIIFNYMKLLDPSSVVREGEFATAQNAAGVPDRIKNLYGQALNGTRLNQQQRKSLLDTAANYYKNYRDSYNQQAEQYRGYAKDGGLNPDRIARRYVPDAQRPGSQQGRVISPTIRRLD